MMTLNISAIILAAGESSRMGKRNKLLTSLDGRPLLHHVLATFCTSQHVQDVILVTGHQAVDVQSSISAFDVRVVHALNYIEGMSVSLRCGVEVLNASCDAFFVALGDMPHISPVTIAQLIVHMNQQRAPVVAPCYQGHRGHPVLFDCALAPQFSTMTGDRGARQILQRNDVALVDVNDPGILKDYDTPESFGSV